MTRPPRSHLQKGMALLLCHISPRSLMDNFSSRGIRIQRVGRVFPLCSSNSSHA